MTTWMTADLHMGHQNILAYARRPFSDLEEMHREIIARWNERVEPGDIVWILGDLAMGRLDESLALCAQLRGTKILLCGNHDRPWAGNIFRKANDWADRYKVKAGISVVIPGQLNDGHALGYAVRSDVASVDHFVYLWHFPYSGDHTESGDRYAEWRPADDGHSWLIHGHVHNAWKVDAARRQINVGVDVWDYAPVSQDQIGRLIDAAPAVAQIMGE